MQGKNAAARSRGGKNPSVQTSQRAARASLPRLLPLAAACLLACGPGATWAACSASDTASLAGCITAANGGGDSTITLANNITLTGTLPVITSSLTVNGGTNSIDGGGTYRGFFVQPAGAATLTLNDLTLNAMRRRVATAAPARPAAAAAWARAGRCSSAAGRTW